MRETTLQFRSFWASLGTSCTFQGPNPYYRAELATNYLWEFAPKVRIVVEVEVRVKDYRESMIFCLFPFKSMNEYHSEMPRQSCFKTTHFSPS